MFVKKLKKKELDKLEKGLDVNQIRTLSEWGLNNEKIAYITKLPVKVINNFMNKHNIVESL